MGNTGRVLGNFSADSISFRPNSTLMEVKVHSSTLKFVPSDVHLLFRLVVHVEGSAIGCDGWGR